MYVCNNYKLDNNKRKSMIEGQFSFSNIYTPILSYLNVRITFGNKQKHNMGGYVCNNRSHMKICVNKSLGYY